MTYQLGAVGFGHWFARLYEGMVKTNQIKLLKVVGVSNISGKADRLRAAGITSENYYQMDPFAPLPDDFLEGLDIVHISNPNKFHAAQTKQSLAAGKIAITEKTWGINREEFYGVVDYIKKNGYEGKAYLHLHYAHKMLTLELPNLLSRFVPQHGKIKSLSSTFFEKASDEDLRRSAWLFSMESGGLFMDWIHPFEIFCLGAGATEMKLDDVDLYLTHPDYGERDPTGICARITLNGANFVSNAKGAIRITKGADETKKAVALTFEDGAQLELTYMDTDVEVMTGKRGTWSLRDAKGNAIESGAATGPETSEIFVQDILKLCRGERAGISLDALKLIFEPQWQYQAMLPKKKLIEDRGKVEKFFKEGYALA